MIGILDYSIEFNGKELLGGCDADFRDGTLTALIGRNGAGKSTLLRSMIGLETRFKGDITVDGIPVKSMSPNERARKMALVATRRERVPGLTCRQAVELGRAPYTTWRGRLSERDNAIVDDALRSVGMEDYVARRIDTLSDGEYQKIMIARALAQDTGILLLDEPTSFLDQPGRYGLCRLLASLAHEEGKCIVFSTHEIDVAFEVCDSIALVVPPHIKCMPASELSASGLMEKYFNTGFAAFDPSVNRIVGRR